MNEETKLYVPALVENTVEQKLFGRLKSYWKICMKLDTCSSQGAPDSHERGCDSVAITSTVSKGHFNIVF